MNLMCHTHGELSIKCFYLIQFNESWRLLVDWMTEVEQTLDTHKEIAVSHEEIKQQLTEQKVHYKHGDMLCVSTFAVHLCVTHLPITLVIRSSRNY